MSELIVEGLVADAAGEAILHGVDVRVAPGEVHAVMALTAAASPRWPMCWRAGAATA